MDMSLFVFSLLMFGVVALLMFFVIDVFRKLQPYPYESPYMLPPGRKRNKQIKGAMKFWITYPEVDKIIDDAITNSEFVSYDKETRIATFKNGASFYVNTVLPVFGELITVPFIKKNKTYEMQTLYRIPTPAAAYRLYDHLKEHLDVDRS